MRRLPLAVLALCCACGDSSGTEVGVLRQAVPLPVPLPLLEGELPGEGLGTSVAACRFDGFVAVGPGDNVVNVVLPSGDVVRRTVPPPNQLGALSACEGSEGSWNAIAASAGGVFAFPADGGPPFGFAGAQSLARSHRRRAQPLAVGRDTPGTIELMGFDPDAGVFRNVLGTTLRLDAGWGSALAWSGDDTVLAVSNARLGVVQLVDTTGAPLSGTRIERAALGGFGEHLVFGDVHPNDGEELLISSTVSREVFVFGKVSGQLRELLRVGPLGNNPASASGLPLPVVIEPTSVTNRGTLHAFWVGVPEKDSVYRFIGDAGEPTSATERMEFGAALAVSGESLIVGAPSYDSPNAPDGGAVFRLEFQTDVLAGAEPRACKGGETCLTENCVAGRCIGGVLCEPVGLDPVCPNQCRAGVCLAPDAGRPDAGVDGGSKDAGDEGAGASDAGESDAGADAGSGPGGPTVFSACGCSSGGLASTSLLAGLMVLLLRRRQFS